MALWITAIATFSLTTAPICHRCHNSVTTPLRTASCIASKMAKLPDETDAIIGLLYRESGWSEPNRVSLNRRSKTYGLGQFKPATWVSVGIKKTDCTVCQIEAIYLYCKHRKQYGSVANAVRLWDRRAKRFVRGKPFGGWY